MKPLGRVLISEEGIGGEDSLTLSLLATSTGMNMKPQRDHGRGYQVWRGGRGLISRREPNYSNDPDSTR